MVNLDKIDRRFIYLLMVLAVSTPILLKYSVRPAEMQAANKLYKVVEEIPTHGPRPAFAMVAMDFGPNSKAENESQAEVIVEHLMRRRVPIVLMSTYALAEAFLRDIPERIAQKLMREDPSTRLEYGKDWINIGFRPGGALFIQALAKSEDIADYIGKDYAGNALKGMDVFRELKTLKDFAFLAEFTGLVGALDPYIQFFQKSDYLPPFGHGCTSITIPEAYIYLDSGQLKGALEGVAGAAWYSELLREHNSKREVDSALIINTALGVAHLAIIFLIILGNCAGLLQGKVEGKRRGGQR